MKYTQQGSHPHPATRPRPSQISTPSYYLAPFHCYPDGNLSWDAALEVDPSAVCVHGNIYTGNKKVYEPDGDEKLRSNYHQRMREMLKVC